MDKQDRIILDLLTAHSNCTEYALNSLISTGMCTAFFDGILCWPPAEKGQIAMQNCPSSFRHSVTVNRSCTFNGSWAEENDYSYSPCGLDPEHKTAMRHLYDILRTKDTNIPPKWYFYHKHAECLDRMSIPMCPMVFDGWACWDYTLAGDTAVAPCPKYITGFDPERYAFRTCTDEGVWFVHPDSGRGWSNYTTCVDVEDLEFHQLVNTFYIVGYSISFIALVLSLFIFVCFRSLKCTRIAIHIQLFLSFVLNNLMWIIWYYYVVADLQVIEDNKIWCQVLHLLLQYLMVVNYAWMFCEGLHLHLALVVVFVKSDVVMRWFYFVGWVLPLLMTITYAVFRILMGVQETERCWMEDSYFTWLLTGPVLLSMLANVVFLINVVRILLTRMHPRSSSPASQAMKKAARATLILIPLFGLHHILIPIRPDLRAHGENIYHIFSSVVVSLQGFCVACMFCFANADVHVAVRNCIRRLCNSRQPINTTSAVGHVMLANTQTPTTTRVACVEF